LRREGDSNPRYSYPYGSLANCWFKPLTHLSFLFHELTVVYPPTGGWFKPLTHLSFLFHELTVVYPPTGGWFKPLTHLSKLMYSHLCPPYLQRRRVTHLSLHPPQLSLATEVLAKVAAKEGIISLIERDKNKKTCTKCKIIA
jgi:hypothetical protein